MNRPHILPDSFASTLANPRILIGSAGLCAVLLMQLAALLLTHMRA